MTGTYTIRVSITAEGAEKLTSGEVVELSNTGGYDLSRAMRLNKAIYVELNVANTVVITFPTVKVIYIENFIIATLPSTITGTPLTLSIGAVNDTISALSQ